MKHYIWIAMTTAMLVATSASVAVADLEYYPPELGGKQVDKCVNDGGKNNCNSTANRIAAVAFCKAKGNPGVVEWHLAPKIPIPLKLMRAYRTYTGNIRFKEILGTDRFMMITCKSNKVSGMPGAKKLGLRIATCVQGKGWQWIDPERCSLQRQREIARKVCRGAGFVDQLSFNIGTYHERHYAFLTYPKGTYYMTGGWGLGKSDKYFSTITCWRY